MISGRAQDQGCLSSRIALRKNRTAKTTVQRFRLRSTIEPPPSGPVPLPTPKAPDRPESLPECMRTRATTMTARITWMIESIVSTPVRVAKEPCFGRRTGAGEGLRAANCLLDGVLRRYYRPDDPPQICQSDYESFTDSWLAADMTPGRRIRAITDYLRRPNPWDDPQMTDSPA